MAKIAHVDIPHNFLMTKQICQKICKSEMQKNEIFAHDLFYGAYHQGDKIERAYALKYTVGLSIVSHFKRYIRAFIFLTVGYQLFLRICTK